MLLRSFQDHLKSFKTVQNVTELSGISLDRCKTIKNVMRSPEITLSHRGYLWNLWVLLRSSQDHLERHKTFQNVTKPFKTSETLPERHKIVWNIYGLSQNHKECHETFRNTQRPSRIWHDDLESRTPFEIVLRTTGKSQDLSKPRTIIWHISGLSLNEYIKRPEISGIYQGYLKMIWYLEGFKEHLKSI